MSRRPELHFLDKLVFRLLTHMLPVDDVPESIEVVETRLLWYLEIKFTLA